MNRNVLLVLALVLLSTPAWGEAMNHDDHGAMDHAQMDQGKMDHGDGTTSGSMDHSKTFLVKTEIDGYTITFHVMDSTESMRHMGPQSLMVKIEKDGAVVTAEKANSKVIHPDGKEESNPMMAMGDWLMAGYDLGHEGKHQLMVLFKSSDGNKHFAAVYYP
jgi:hypothetical protein